MMKRIMTAMLACLAVLFAVSAGATEEAVLSYAEERMLSFFQEEQVCVPLEASFPEDVYMELIGATVEAPEKLLLVQNLSFGMDETAEPPVSRDFVVWLRVPQEDLAAADFHGKGVAFTADAATGVELEGWLFDEGRHEYCVILRPAALQSLGAYRENTASNLVFEGDTVTFPATEYDPEAVTLTLPYGLEEYGAFEEHQTFGAIYDEETLEIVWVQYTNG